MITPHSLAAGAAGIVVDVIEIGLPVYARWLNVVTTCVVNVPDAEMLGPVIIRSGDPLLGDANGLLRLDPTYPGLAALVDRAVANESCEAAAS